MTMKTPDVRHNNLTPMHSGNGCTRTNFQSAVNKAVFAVRGKYCVRGSRWNDLPTAAVHIVLSRPQATAHLASAGTCTHVRGPYSGDVTSVSWDDSETSH